MTKSIAFIFLGMLVATVSSCVQSTPQYRIQQRPQAFERLSEKHKELVSRGQIAKGMTKEAVSLAWGSPSAQSEGLKDGKMFERWYYTGKRQVVTSNVWGGYDSGYFGPYRYSGVGGGFGPYITYFPYVKSSVWFIDGKVDEWVTEK